MTHPSLRVARKRSARSVDSTPRTKNSLAILQEEVGLDVTPIEAADIEEWNFGSFEGFDGGIWVNNELIPYTAGKS